MKVRTVSIAKLRARRQFENDRAEIVVELEPGDEIDAAIAHAHDVCDRALALGDPNAAPRVQRRTPTRNVDPDPPPQIERPIEPYGAPRKGPSW